MAFPEIIDLSHTLHPSISVFPGCGQPAVRPVATLEQQGYREKELVISTHHGTHIDCPFHLLTDGFHTGNAPPELFYGKGLVMDCRSLAPEARIDTPFFREAEKKIAAAEFILLLTGMDRHWGNPAYAGGYPVPDLEAAKYLARFPLKGIGIDALSIDRVEDTELSVHKALLSAGILILENLQGLDRLLNKNFVLCCFPLKIAEGDGSPVRACAVME